MLPYSDSIFTPAVLAGMAVLGVVVVVGAVVIVSKKKLAAPESNGFKASV